jgi:enoyl-CoA hydratase/carnithine racemase
MTPRLLEELENALWEADDDCAVHCVVIHGKEDSFSSGYDLTALGGTKRPGYRTGRTHDDDIWLIGQNNRLQLTGDLVTGADAEKIGLVMKSVPAEVLEDEVEGLADRFSLIDPDLLAANKRITNLALELMGAARSSGRCSRADRRGFRAGALAAMPASVRLFGGRGVVARRPSSQLTST